MQIRTQVGLHYQANPSLKKNQSKASNQPFNIEDGEKNLESRKTILFLKKKHSAITKLQQVGHNRGADHY